MFFPIFVKTNLKTPFCSYIFFWLIKVIAPSFVSRIQSPFHIACPFTFGHYLYISFFIGKSLDLDFKYSLSMMIYPFWSTFLVISTCVFKEEELVYSFSENKAILDAAFFGLTYGLDDVLSLDSSISISFLSDLLVFSGLESIS